MAKSVSNSNNNREMQQSSSSSRRHNFQWTTRVGDSFEDDEGGSNEVKETSGGDEMLPQPSEKQSDGISGGRVEAPLQSQHAAVAGVENSRKKKVQGVSRLRSVLITAFGRIRQQSQSQQRVVLGTLFGNKRGYVHFAFQKDAKSQPTLLIQLATPITGLVREMSSGLVRIALETEKRGKTPSVPLIEEASWRTYCNGTKCGQATRLKCGEKEWKILKAVEPISMGAGVLPAEGEGEEEVIYMRAKFERVVGSTDSEALYMVNPDNNAAPELSIYLLRL